MTPLFLLNTVAPKGVEFYNRYPSNLLLLENAQDGSVVIRAAEDNFTQGQKRVLIRYLETEGFISNLDDLHDPTNHSRTVAGGKVTYWVYDPAWPHIDRHLNLYMRRLIYRIFLGVAAVLCLLAALLLL